MQQVSDHFFPLALIVVAPLLPEKSRLSSFEFPHFWQTLKRDRATKLLFILINQLSNFFRGKFSQFRNFLNCHSLT